MLCVPAAFLLFALVSPAGKVQGGFETPAVRTGSQEGSADTRLGEARALVEKGSVDQAEVLVRGYLKDHPESGEGHFLLGLVLFREIQQGALRSSRPPAPGEFPASAFRSAARDEKARASLAEFTLGAKYRKPGVFELKIVALNYVLLGDYTDAAKWLTKALEWNPRDHEAWYYLGRAKYNQNRFEEAIAAFEKCLELEPRDVKAKANLGLAYAGLGRVPEALAALKTAIAWQTELPEKSPEPYIDLGELLLQQDRSEEALGYLLEAARLPSKDGRLHERLGKAYLNLNQLEKARAEYEAAIAEAPEDASLHYLLGQVYRRQGLQEKAKMEFDRSESLRPTSGTPKSMSESNQP